MWATHTDWRFPAVAFFAKAHVEAGAELVYNYGDKPHPCFCDDCEAQAAMRALK